MWQSKDDVLRDLASLSDFGNSEDKESYEILYSVGRGLKTKEKHKSQVKFIDSRSGEAINLEEEVLDPFNNDYKSIGRGSLLGSLFRTKLQLQQQLRLARPMGSGDEAVESYYGRSKHTEKNKSIRTTCSEPVDENPAGTLESNAHKPESNSNEIRKRVKATRNSTTQVNALISNLLSKSKVESDKANGERSKDEHLSSNFSDAEKIMDKSSLSDLNSNMSNKQKNLKTLGVNYARESTNEILPKKYIGDENFKIIDDNDDDDDDDDYNEQDTKKNETLKQDEKLYKNDFGYNISAYKNLEKENDRIEKYRSLGERLHRSEELRSSTTRSRTFDSAIFFDSCASKESVIFNDKDFPPLQKS